MIQTKPDIYSIIWKIYFAQIADIFLEMHFFVYIVCFSLAHFHDDKKQRYIDCATFQLWKFCKHALIGFDLIMSEIYINQKLFTW